MPQQPIFPFRRVSVDHMVRGVTRVWWDLDRLFREPGPYAFQLQYGYTGSNNSVDWRNIGAPVINGYFALTTEIEERLVSEQFSLNDTSIGIGLEGERSDTPHVAYDPLWREGGYDLLTHYRVTLTTAKGTYVSQPANCHGELTERDWLLSREIIRKEQLRHRLVSVPGYLIKRYRYGKPCGRCRDELTQEVTDNNCPVCNGTGFEVGYHPPVPLMCWDLSPELIQENVDAQLRGTTRENAYVSARVIGFPALSKEDIWVNGTNDERWVVDTVQVAAAMRGVPLVYNVKLGLLPFNNTAYAIEVGGEPVDRDPRPVLPIEGCGNNVIDHNFGGPDELSYMNAAGVGIGGAHVYIFRQADVAAASPAIPNRMLAVAATTTTANGRWAMPLRLKAGDYGVLYEKLGEYGPDLYPITVIGSASTAVILTEALEKIIAEHAGNIAAGLELEPRTFITETPAAIAVLLTEALERIIIEHYGNTTTGLELEPKTLITQSPTAAAILTEALERIIIEHYGTIPVGLEIEPQTLVTLQLLALSMKSKLPDATETEKIDAAAELQKILDKNKMQLKAQPKEFKAEPKVVSKQPPPGTDDFWAV